MIINFEAGGRAPHHLVKWNQLQFSDNRFSVDSLCFTTFLWVHKPIWHKLFPGFINLNLANLLYRIIICSCFKYFEFFCLEEVNFLFKWLVFCVNIFHEFISYDGMRAHDVFPGPLSDWIAIALRASLVNVLRAHIKSHVVSADDRCVFKLYNKWLLSVQLKAHCERTVRDEEKFFNRIILAHEDHIVWFLPWFEV